MKPDTIVCGDCLDVMRGMQDECVDLIVADPPYGINYVSARPKHRRDIHVPIANDSDAIWDVWPRIARELYRIAKDDAAMFAFTRWDMWGKLTGGCAPWVVKNMIVWDKGTHTAGDLTGNYGFAHELICYAVKGRPLVRGKRLWNVWRYAKIPPTRLSHSMQKPIALIGVAIRSMSNKGDLVFDPFLGSGTTVVAAKKQGRHYFGCDISQEYVDMTNKRLARVTGIQLPLLDV